MGRIWRNIAYIAVLALVISGIASGRSVASTGPRWGEITGPVIATSLGIHMPRTLAEVATLSSDDLARIHASAAAQSPKVRALIEAGVLTPEKKVAYPQQTVPTGRGRLWAPLASHLFVDARCVIEWQPYPFTGTYVWAWGQTVSNATAWVHAIGNLYQNGNWKATFGQSHSSTVAYGRTADFWVAWWDHPVFLATSQHYIQVGGSYDWGPWNCSVNKTI